MRSVRGQRDRQYLLDARTLMERDFDYITDTVVEVLA